MAPRRGVAVLVVLLAISVAMAISYSVMRSEGTARRIDDNTQLREAARRAAHSGLAMGIRRMHDAAAWEGVEGMYDETVELDANFDASFVVTYKSGDHRLDPDNLGDLSPVEYALRVTLAVTGTATDPADPNRIANQKIEAVVQLVPRKLADRPEHWETLTHYTVCHSTPGQSGSFNLNVPVQIEGDVRVRSQLNLSQDLNWSDEARARYFADLGLLADEGIDWRPVTGRVDFHKPIQEGKTLEFLESMDIEARETLDLADYAWPDPPGSLGYRLFAGGRRYYPTEVPKDLQEVELGPDPLLNPLGIFRRSNTVCLREDVVLAGMLTTSRDLHFHDPGADLRPIELPGPEGPMQLPTLVSDRKTIVYDEAIANVRGMLLVGDTFEVRSAPQSQNQFFLQGKLAAKELDVQPRAQWNRTSNWWDSRYEAFLAQEHGIDGIPLWPIWLLSRWDLDPEAAVVLRSEEEPVEYHWQDQWDAIYVPGDGDEGLRWELLDWQEKQEPQAGG